MRIICTVKGQPWVTVCLDSWGGAGLVATDFSVGLWRAGCSSRSLVLKWKIISIDKSLAN